jgi:hypothetical protein
MHWIEREENGPDTPYLTKQLMVALLLLHGARTHHVDAEDQSAMDIAPPDLRDWLQTMISNKDALAEFVQTTSKALSAVGAL